MSETHSTAPATSGKPAKPHPDFPLFPHAAGVWAKKIRGKLHYFGPWADPDGALAKYLAEKDDLHAGRKPRKSTDGLTVKELVNGFLNAKQAQVDVGELSPLTWNDYKRTCDLLVKECGKQRIVADLGPDDFGALRNKMARQWGPHHLAKTIQCVRCVLKHAFDSGLIDRPIRYGPGFKRPSQKTLRLHRAKQGVKLFTADEIRELVHGTLIVGPVGPELVQAGPQLRAMILLGINAGMGNTDCGSLPLSALDLKRGWIDFPRPKTGIPRRCPLWPETVAAIRDALASRKEAKDPADAGLAFITKYGKRWVSKEAGKVRPDGKVVPPDNSVTKETRKLLNALGINGHRSFYCLRHTFRTVADEAKDQPAADHIMGHESTHMSSVYRERISDQRLQAVVDHVRAWLFAAPSKAADKREEEE
jgi:integrase